MHKLFYRSHENEVSQQQRHPPGGPPSASCSCTSCHPTCAGHMAQVGTDWHEGRVAVQNGAHHTSPATDPPVGPLNSIVCPNAGPMLKGKFAVGQRPFNAIFHLLDGFLQLHCPQFFHDGSDLLMGRLTSLFSCTIFSGMVCFLLLEWCVVTSFYQRSANHIFLSLFQFAQFILPYH